MLPLEAKMRLFALIFKFPIPDDATPLATFSGLKVEHRRAAVPDMTSFLFTGLTVTLRAPER